jgi:thiamine-phosphate pyrophosphorylase
MIRSYITDRWTLPPGESFLSAIARNLADPAGPDWIQIREKDLSARELLKFVRSALDLPNPRGVKFLVNSRVDVAIAAGAAGAHLPSNSPRPNLWRAITPPRFLIGVSCHTVDEVRIAADEGADYAVFGPVFPPLSKTSDMEARGLAQLARAAAAVKIPVLALGGITRANAANCVSAGAAGVAGISLFQSPTTQPR